MMHELINTLLQKLKPMKWPKKLPIERWEEEDSYTYYLGSTADGKLFWAYSIFVYSAGYIIKNDWKEHRHEYALLHLFDKQGRYLSTSHWNAGTSNQGNDVLVEAKLAQWIAELQPVRYHDIKVELFSTVIDGYLFGLIPDEELEIINLKPGSAISFEAPWDGEYYT
ncbi:hypothetical protein [Hymenobacter canadensis]|uniref:Uncharacterized protein n=1 Tax=Hymenobacter canadensis TaxID=2999067 RepID=A0ABY7LLF7_9BACT|nr:hypothetical protein [Hymenobacter canadensis]WBA40291.1 hypothetical protein O3303_10660 [Hymenobacter canadensis]